MPPTTVSRRLVTEEDPLGFYTATNLRNLHAVAHRACQIASQQSQEAIALHYGSGRSIAIGTHDRVSQVRTRLERGESDAVRVRKDGSYMVISNNLQKVGQAIIQLKKHLKEGQEIHFHWPNGETLLIVHSATTHKTVWFELGREMKLARAAA